jgi:hypothetical protein
LLTSVALHPQQVTNDSTALDSLRILSNSSKIERQSRDLQSYRLLNDTITLKGGLHPDTVKASKDTTKSKESVPSEEIKIVIVAAVVVAAICLIIYASALGDLSRLR